jgi:hypothetical protein
VCIEDGGLADLATILRRDGVDVTATQKAQSLAVVVVAGRRAVVLGVVVEAAGFLVAAGRTRACWTAPPSETKTTGRFLP